MLVFRSTTITSLVLASALALPAVVRGQDKQCAVDEGKPSEVARAYLTISQVANAGPDAKPQEIESKLTAAVRALAESKSKENPTGQAYEMGKLLSLWAMQPDVSIMASRSRIGLPAGPDSTINLAAAVDSQFKIVEKASPECESETLKWRSQKPWISLVNGSIQDLGAGSYDSAAVHAQWSLDFNSKAPYGYMVLAQVAQHREQTDTAIALFQKAITLSAADSSYNNVKWQSELNLGALASSAAEGAQDPAAKAKYAAAAKAAYESLANDNSATSAYRDQARSSMVQVSLEMGDTASAKAAYQPQLTDPSKFSFNQLIQAGVAAAHAEDDDAARTLFRSAYVANPYHRDALSNLAIYEIRAQHYDTALTLVQRLNEVDPNGNNGRVKVLTYAGIAKKYADLNKDIVARYGKAKGAAAKKVLSDSATLTTDSNRVYTDLAVKANMPADSVPVVVAFNEFSNTKDTVTLAGTVTNNAESAKTYTMKVEFLDKTGGVVASQQQTVGPVAPHTSARFSVSANAPGAAAFKYAPLDN